MSRTLNEIQEIILQKKAVTASLSPLEVLTTSEQNTLSNLTSTSKVSIWRLWSYICAFSIWTLEQIFDAFRVEIQEIISLNKIGSLSWYRQKMLEFQLGFSLSEMGVYDNTNAIQAEVLASLIVKQSAIEELDGKLKIKVATEDENGDLIPLSGVQMAAFKNYAEAIKYAGTRLILVSRVPDDFKTEYVIYYDPLVLDAFGSRLDGQNSEPVQDAVRSFLRNLEFNGEIILTKLTDFLQLIEGVEEPVLVSASAKYGLYPYAAVNEFYIADAGYMKLDELNTNFTFVSRGL
jgi:hypothetical protein